jgi:hypothetical protein
MRKVDKMGDCPEAASRASSIRSLRDRHSTAIGSNTMNDLATGAHHIEEGAAFSREASLALRAEVPSEGIVIGGGPAGLSAGYHR